MSRHFRQSASVSQVKKGCQELVSANPGSVVLFIYECGRDEETSHPEQNLEIQYAHNSDQQNQGVIYFYGNANGLGSSLERIIVDFEKHIAHSSRLNTEISHTIDQPWCCFTAHANDADTRTNESETGAYNKETVSKMCKELAESEPPGCTSSTLLVYVPPPVGNDPLTISTNNVSLYPGDGENSEEGK